MSKRYSANIATMEGISDKEKNRENRERERKKNETAVVTSAAA